MAEVAPKLWRNRLVYLGGVFLIVFGRLLPLDVGSATLPGPDLILLLTYALVLRRPDAMPVALIAAVTLMTDVLFYRPLGLWTACVIIGLEFLRARESLSRDMPFLAEWFMVGAVIAAISVLNMAILTIFGVIRPTLGRDIIQMIVTIFTYPAVVLIVHSVLGIAKITPGAVDQLGRKL